MSFLRCELDLRAELSTFRDEGFAAALAYSSANPSLVKQPFKIVKITPISQMTVNKLRETMLPQVVLITI